MSPERVYTISETSQSSDWILEISPAFQRHLITFIDGQVVERKTRHHLYERPGR